MEDVAARLNVTEKLEKAGLDSPRDLLTRSLADLQRELSLGESAANELLDAAASEVYPWRSRLSSLRAAARGLDVFSTGDETLDQVLGGGMPIGSVTEVVGESSSGKTQFCLQLCLAVQKPVSLGGIGGCAVYLHSEGRFPGTRLDQLASTFSNEYRLEADAMRRSIYTMHIPDREAQQRILCYQLPALLERRKSIRLVIVDSISAHYRGLGSKDNFERMAEISEMGSRLKKIAHKFNVAVVAVNQVSDTISRAAATLSNNQAAQHQQQNTLPPELVENWMDFHLVGLKRSPLALFWTSLSKKPVLGFSWANSVTTRIRLARSPIMDRVATKRALFIEMSPVVARQGCLFEISTEGVRGMQGSSRAVNNART